MTRWLVPATLAMMLGCTGLVGADGPPAGDTADPDHGGPVAEAPADARSLRPPRQPSRLLGVMDLEQDYLRDVDEAIPEPWRLLATLPCPYHRLQARLDHQHGLCALHARVMLDAAPGPAWLNGRPWRGSLQVLPGRMHENGADVMAILDGILESVGGTPSRRDGLPSGW